MSISNLDGKQARATFDSRTNTVTVTHEDPRKNQGEPLEIPVGALRSVAWQRTPQEGKEKPGTVVFTFRNPPRDLPKQMQVGRVEAVTTRTNVAFVEGLQDAVAHTRPDDTWQQPVDMETFAQLHQRRGWGKTLLTVLLVAVVTAALALGVRAWRDNHGGASNQAGDALASMSEEQKAPLFHNYLVTVGIKGTQADEVAAAKSVCRQFDKGYSFDQIAMALLLVDNGMTAEQKGQFIGVSVSWWCPQHQAALHAGVSEK